MIIASVYGDVGAIAHSFGDGITFDVAYVAEQKWLSKAKLRSRKIFLWLIREFWGITSSYGTSPSRFALVLTMVILIFSLCYSTTYFSYSNLPHLEIKDASYPNGYCSYLEALLNSIYFSVITLTTVGFGDITPYNYFARLMVPIEALLGVSLFGVFVTMITRKLPTRRFPDFPLDG